MLNEKSDRQTAQGAAFQRCYGTRLGDMMIFKQHIPDFVETRDPPPEVPFQTTAELLAWPAVQRWSQRTSFSHFAKRDNLLMAIYRGGYEWWVVGYVSDPAALDLPLWDGGKYRARLPDGTLVHLTAKDVKSSCADVLTLLDGSKVEDVGVDRGTP